MHVPTKGVALRTDDNYHIPPILTDPEQNFSPFDVGKLRRSWEGLDSRCMSRELKNSLGCHLSVPMHASTQEAEDDEIDRRVPLSTQLRHRDSSRKVAVASHVSVVQYGCTGPDNLGSSISCFSSRRFAYRTSAEREWSLDLLASCVMSACCRRTICYAFCVIGASGSASSSTKVEDYLWIGGHHAVPIPY